MVGGVGGFKISVEGLFPPPKYSKSQLHRKDASDSSGLFNCKEKRGGFWM